MATLFDLQAIIRLDSDQFENGVKQAEKSGSSLATSLKSGLATAAKVGAAAIGAVTAASGALYTGITAAAGSVAAYGDNIDKMSQKMGMSAEAYQEWDAVMQHSGTSIESLQAGMKTLANAVENGNDAFNRLGISQEEIAKMSNEELFSATITALQNVENETERTYLAGQLLGRGATELGALLNTSAEDTQAMKDRVHELGGVMSDEAVKASARYQDSLQDMKTSFSGLKNNLIGDFLPGLSTVMDGIASLVTGENGAQSTISSGISQMLETMNSSLPRFFDAGKEVVEAIFQAVIRNLPQMVSGGIEILMSIVDGIVNNIDEIIDSTIEVIDAVIDGLTNNLPKLVEGGVKLTIALAVGLIKAIPKLLAAVPRIIDAVVIGIANSLAPVVQAGRDFVEKVKDGFMEKVNAAKEWGKDLISNFIDGLLAKWNKLKNTVSDIAGSIADFIGFSEPEKGPLSNFHTYAPDMMKLFAQGIHENERIVTDQIQKSFDFRNSIVDGMDFVGSYTPSISTAKANTVSSTAAQNNTDALLTAILNKLDGMGVYLDGTTLTGYVDSRLGKQTEDNRRFVMA